MALRGLDADTGSLASEITRAFAIGNDRCCEASSWRARNVW
jgi:hypothetical protein